MKQRAIKTFSTGRACDSTFDLPRSTPKLLKAACRDRTASRFALAVNHPCKRTMSSNLTFGSKAKVEELYVHPKTHLLLWDARWLVCSGADANPSRLATRLSFDRAA